MPLNKNDDVRVISENVDTVIPPTKTLTSPESSLTLSNKNSEGSKNVNKRTAYSP
jgi:hypothetical protein